MKSMTRLAILASLLLPACAISGLGDDTGESEQGVSTTYTDLLDFEGVDQGLWYDQIHQLNAEFDGLCGDTFCEGDFGNITPLTFSCAVTSKAGKVKDCQWTFAASQTEVDVTNAKVLTNGVTYVCPIHVNTTAVKLQRLFSTTTNARLIDTPLPGAPSIYEQIGDCFEHPTGDTPNTPAGYAPQTYVAGENYYKSGAYANKWYAAKAALKQGFDRVCGDTFCGSDFGDLQSMDFTCSVTKSTGNVKECAWTFGGSWHLVDEHGAGHIDGETKTFTCKFGVNGSLSQFLNTLTASGTDQPIHRPLPGGSASAYDALLGCLP